MVDFQKGRFSVDSALASRAYTLCILGGRKGSEGEGEEMATVLKAYMLQA